MNKYSLWFVIAIMLASCSSNKPIVRTTKPVYKKPTHTNTSVPKKTTSTTPSSTNDSENKTEVLEAITRVKVTTVIVQEYIAKYKDIAQSNMKQYGIPASIIIGQGILESGAGTGPLSNLANNHFGIKCHKEWTGPSVKHDDDAAQECFRKYDQPYESFKDHALFLTARPWYQPLFKLPKDDYKQWAKGLKAAGYATDPKYPEKLISIIERYQLYQYDSEVLGKEYTPINTKSQTFANSDLYEVSKGDTLYSISKKFNISIDALRRKNDISDNTISIGQNLIIK